MTTITGTCITNRGASLTHLSVDFGTFAVTAEFGTLIDPKTGRRVSPGFVRLADNPDGSRNEWPATVSWGIDSFNRATQVAGTGTSPNGAPFRMETTAERENNDPRRSKSMDGGVTILD